MASVGETLKKAREEQGWSVDWVASELKLRVDYVRAMEEDRWNVFPAPVYAKGALRSYARLLKLDPEPLVDIVRETLEGKLQPRCFHTSGDSGQGWWDKMLFNFTLVLWRRWVVFVFILVLIVGAIVIIALARKGGLAQKNQIKPTVVMPSSIPGEQLPLNPRR